MDNLEEFNIAETYLKPENVLITDIFNIFTRKVRNNMYNRYNFIIDDSDTITKMIFSRLVSHINETDNENTSTKIYVNPTTIYSNSITIYTTPPPAKIKNDNVDKFVKFFKFPFHTLTVDDRAGIPTVALNKETLANIYIDKIWIYNPAYTVKENADILMQKLIGGPTTINSVTYNTLIREIIQYKSFKLFNLDYNRQNANICDNKSYTHSMFGFDLTKWP